MCIPPCGISGGRVEPKHRATLWLLRLAGVSATLAAAPSVSEPRYASPL